MTHWESHYRRAKRAVYDAGYGKEADYIAGINFDRVTEQDVLGEAAWVVYNAGLSVKVLSTKFPAISAAFDGFTNTRAIALDPERYKNRAMAAFGHAGKADAVIAIARRIFGMGIDDFKDWIRRDGVDALETLPYIGETTKWHLARNIGLDVSKPDRHLTRLAEALGAASPAALCSEIAQATGDRVGYVDYILFRWCEMTHDPYASFQVVPI